MILRLHAFFQAAPPVALPVADPASTRSETTGLRVTCPRNRYLSWWLTAVLGAGLLPLNALAQAPTIIGLSPTRNVRNAAAASNVAVTFSQPMQNATGTQQAVRVFSPQRGGLMFGTTRGVASVSGNTITFNPTNDFKPGETVLVTTTTAAQSSGGTPLTRGHVHQFTAATVANGTGSFVAPATNPNPSVGSSPRSVAVGDVDGDGDLDLLTVNSSANTVSVRLNDGTGNFTAPATNPNPSVGSSPWGVALGDVDGDGDLDFLVSNGFANSVSVRLNDGTGNFTVPATNPNPSVGNSPRTVTLGDVDGDGDLDFLCVNQSSNTVSVRLNNGAGNFTAPATNPEVSVGATPRVGVVGDVDNDGDLDLLVLANGSSAVSVRLNDGTGNFTAPATNPEVSVGATPQSVAVGDVDGDGDLDLLATSSFSSAVSVRLNNGTGNFTAPATNPEVSVGAFPSNIAVGDVDGDGDLDFLVNNQISNTVSVRLNDGAGNFTAAANANPSVGASPTSIAVGDLDGDGDLDLVTSNQNSNNVSVRLNLVGPTLTSLSPTGGLVGTSVTLTGTNLSSTTAVSFNGTAATTVNVVSATTVTATVPAGATTGNVTLTAAGGPSNALPFRVWYDPISLSLSNTAVVENAGTTVGTFSTTDPNSGETFAYTLVGGAGSADNGDFTISGNSLQLNAPADYETQTSYAIRVRVTDSDGLFIEQPFTVTVTDVAEPLIVSATQTVPGGHYSTLTVTGTGVATLGGAVEVDDAVLVQTGGILADNCQPITGTGSFTLESGATLRICAPDGIAAFGAGGAIQVAGGRTFPADATYAYVGTQAQTTGTGLPFIVRELVTANAAGVTLSRSVSVAHVLRLSSGVLNTNGETLTLLSDDTRTAYAIHAGGSTSGDVTVERYVGGPTASGYRHLSSPVQNTTVADLQTSGFVPQVNAAYNALPYVAPPINQFPNVFGFDETRGGTAGAYAGFTVGYYSPAAPTDVLTSGRGWTVYLPGGKTPDFVGALTTGNVARFLTATGANSSPNTRKAGWHLLGNPYAQPIDWDLATVPTGMDAAISVYRTAGGQSGAYLTRANGIGSLPDGVLPVGQAFFARVTASRTFSFTNAMRVEANPATVARTTTETRPVVSLTLGKHGATVGRGADATYVYFETGATAGFDGRFDGYKPGRNVGIPTLTTLIGTDEAAINGLPETTRQQGVVLPLLLDLPAAGIYELSAEVLNLTGDDVVLADQLTGTRVDLHQVPTYTFRTSQAGQLTGRFTLEINVGRVTGVASEIGAQPLTLYPNPAHGTVRVMGATGALSLLDATGRVVRTAPATADALDLSGLSAGVYVVRSGTQTRRLVIE